MPPPSRTDPIPGVNLWGYLRTESGVGEHARTLLAALDEARVPVVPIDFPDSRSRREHPLPPGAREEPVFDVHLICVNADQTPHFVARVGTERLAGHRIGYWHWEVEEFPDWMAESAELVDEVWTASAHSAGAIRGKVTKPVQVVPPAVDPPPPSRLPAGLVAAGEGPLFLTCFDFDSVIERKNPQGAIEAFRRAFPSGGARLLVKSVNGHLHGDRLAALVAAAADRPDIRVFDRFLDRGEQAALIAACDVFVSLHRAEGFGLMLAEAMWLGKAVVATGYSGNLEFMSETTGRLVPWRAVPIPPGAGPYGGTWAEPDLDAAAAAMRELAAAPEGARELGARGRAALTASHGVAARSELLTRRLLASATTAAPPGATDDAWIESLAEKIRRGPAPDGHAVLGRLGVALRRLLLRAGRHAWLHQRGIDLALLEAIAAAERGRRVADERARIELAKAAAWSSADLRLAARHRHNSPAPERA